MRIFIATLVFLATATEVVAMSPPLGRPARIALLEGSERVALQSADTTLRCTTLDDCEFETRYRVRSESELDVMLVADGHRVAGVELEVDGRPVLRNNVVREGDVGRELPAVTRTTRAFDVRLPAGESTITLRGALRPRGDDDVFGVEVALRFRHPILGDDPGWERRNLLVDMSPLDTWGGTPIVTVDVEMPAGVQVTSAPELDAIGPEATQVSVWAMSRPTGLVHGGPYVGAGAVLDEPRGWFGRVGYEFGLGMLTVFGLALDWDFDDRIVVAPTIHTASPGFSCVFPSFGLGVGPALRLGGVTTIGGRGVVEVQLPFVGLVGTLDWYPGLDSPDRIDFALLGRLSL